ncbi:RHS repeat domain-containing protein [Lacinutrix sp. MEBiC02404]
MSQLARWECMHNAEGEQTWERSLDTFGKVIKGDNNSCPFMYQGQYYDSEIELAYNRFRYYDPEDGRYISQDPIGLLSDEYNLYNYVGDTNAYIDAFGLAGYKGRKNKDGSPSKKRGPKTKGENGPHNDVIGKKAKELDDLGWKIEEGGNIEAEKLHITGGVKNRRPYILATKDGKTKVVNVGKQKRDGTPIKREQQAIDDLSNIFDDVEFVPYN